jgi:hypothetical protein
LLFGKLEKFPFSLMVCGPALAGAHPDVHTIVADPSAAI